MVDYDVDVCSDIYFLGCVVYYMLIGVFFFDEK